MVDTKLIIFHELDLKNKINVCPKITNDEAFDVYGVEDNPPSHNHSG